MTILSDSRAMRAPSAGAPLQLDRVVVAGPGPGHVRVTVEACGVCHSDFGMTSGGMPGAVFPLTPGHEISGRIESLGAGVEGWRVGDRVAVGWFGGADGTCDACRDGDAINCSSLRIPGMAYPGGYSDAVLVPANALARVPDELSAAEAAPLACAGVTTFNALYRSEARAGDLVAILGVGGLGHLGVQFAARMGFETVAIARGSDKADMALKLGAAHYIDSTAENVPAALQALGGAKVVLATVTNSAAMAAAFDGLGRRGEMIVVGASPEPIGVNPIQLLMPTRRVSGHASGTALDTERTMRFAAQTGVRAWIEEMPLERAGDAVAKMLSGEARFRMVLTTGN